MKITLTGSLGHIGRPLTKKLAEKDHDITVKSNTPERQHEIEALSARAAIGSIENTEFLKETFTGADVVYCMEPEPDFFDESKDLQAHWFDIARNYWQAVQQSGVTRVIHLSSIGAHTDKGNGMLASHHYVENLLRQLPENISIKFMRPVGFYHNIFAFIPTIKTQGAIIQNYGGDEKEPWVSPLDIASAITDEVEKPFEGRTVRYIASDEVSPNEVANILGQAIGKPDLEWRVVSDDQFRQGLLEAGMTPQAAEGVTGMNAGRRNGLYEDYNQNRPALGKVKMTDFAKEFAEVYNQQ